MDKWIEVSELLSELERRVPLARQQRTAHSVRQAALRARWLDELLRELEAEAEAEAEAVA